MLMVSQRESKRALPLKVLRTRGLGMLLAVVCVCWAPRTGAQLTEVSQMATRWTLPQAPVLRVGDDADPRLAFTRVVGAARFPDGRLVVADGGTQELRVFAADGRLLRILSRRGQGPGEFTNISVVRRLGDSIAVLEGPPGPSQVSFLSAEAFQSRRTFRGGVTALGSLADGTLLVTGGRVRVATAVPAPGHVMRDSITVGLIKTNDMSGLLRLGEFPNRSWFGYRLTSGPVRQTMSSFPFGPALHATATRTHVWIGDSGTGRIRIYDAKGVFVREVSSPCRPRSFSRASLERARSSAMSRVASDDARSRVEAIFSTPRPSTAPQFSRLMAGALNEIWIECFEEDASGPRRAVAMDSSGTAIGTVVLPPGVTMHEIGADYALGVLSDDDGVESVVLYRLER